MTDIKPTVQEKIAWAKVPQEFNDWWNSDYSDESNPFRINSAAYWAWAGWSEAVRLNAPAVPDGVPLEIIRKWPDGFNDRLQHVWLDVVSFIPSVKLYDLQLVLAEFGLRMEVYEDAPAAPQPAQQDDDESDALTVAYLHGHGKGKDSVQPLLAEKDALLRQALEALENGARVRNAEGGTKYQPPIEEAAIEAIRNHLGVKND